MSSLDLGYDALDHQADFHDSDAPTKALFGGNGSGKTWGLCWEAIYLSYENRGCVGLFVEPSYPMARDIAVVTFRRILDDNAIPYRWRASEFRLELPWFGASILIRSADRREALEGVTAAWALLDEAPLYGDGPGIYSAVSARLRDPQAKRRVLGLGGTFEGWDWTASFFDERERPEPGNYEWFHAPTTSNSYLPADYLARLETALPTEAHRQQRLFGKRVDLYRGAAYVSFDRARHILEVETPPAGRLVHALDFNVDPACSLVGVRQGATFLVLDEIRIEGGCTTDDVATEFLRRYGDWSGEVVVHGDQTSTRRDTRGTVSDFTILATRYSEHFGRRFLGCDLPSANPLEVDRVNAVNAAFRRGDIAIHPRCQWLVRDLSRVAWKSGARAIDKGDHALTHLSDALGYWIHREAPVALPVAARSPIAPVAPIMQPWRPRDSRIRRGLARAV